MARRWCYKCHLHTLSFKQDGIGRRHGISRRWCYKCHVHTLPCKQYGIGRRAWYGKNVLKIQGCHSKAMAAAFRQVAKCWTHFPKIWSWVKSSLQSHTLWWGGGPLMTCLQLANLEAGNLAVLCWGHWSCNLGLSGLGVGQCHSFSTLDFAFFQACLELFFWIHWPCLPFSYVFRAGTPLGNKYLGWPPCVQAAGLGMECPFPKSQLDGPNHTVDLLVN